MPAPFNGPRPSFTTGRNRLTVQNIASKGGNIYTALNRDRQTGIGGQLNQAPKPASTAKPKSTYAPSESLKKLKELRDTSRLQTNPGLQNLPGAADFSKTLGGSQATINANNVAQANVTALALAALRKQQGVGRRYGGAPQGQATGYLQKLAQRLTARRHGWNGEGQWNALRELVMRESSWNPKADNPTSTAYGLFQFLDSTRENYGLGLDANARKQIIAGLQYIADRYGSPKKALRFHTRNNWY